MYALCECIIASYTWTKSVCWSSGLVWTSCNERCGIAFVDCVCSGPDEERVEGFKTNVYCLLCGEGARAIRTCLQVVAFLTICVCAVRTPYVLFLLLPLVYWVFLDMVFCITRYDKSHCRGIPRDDYCPPVVVVTDPIAEQPRKATLVPDDDPPPAYAERQSALW
jgi:hypothetical protein